MILAIINVCHTRGSVTLNCSNSLSEMTQVWCTTELTTAYSFPILTSSSALVTVYTIQWCLSLPTLKSCFPSLVRGNQNIRYCWNTRMWRSSWRLVTAFCIALLSHSLRPSVRQHSSADYAVVVVVVLVFVLVCFWKFFYSGDLFRVENKQN